METKQTAVEWLMDKMLQNGNAIFIGGGYLTLFEIRERAKAMEKEQIKDAYKKGQCNVISSEQYYNETYEN